ncbi:unnamed protein product [Arabis nemorensis]|uniref:Uncharacterized protein n=1 Tax=Arabis nemorensis TaxID=586526 RepID=A0A565AYH2_9BRAS|nr:unnamed protein product [Arabis nemorensis]
MMKNWPLVGSQLTKYLPPKEDKYTHDCFTGLDPMRRVFRFPAKGITVKELGIIKLTALFAARYGNPFRYG